MYKPLPKELTIKNSEIEGLGLFTMCDIESDYIFGVTHIKDGKHSFPNGYIRTQLGGFINHSDEPNCKKVKNIIKKEDLLGKWSSIQYELVTTKKITQGDEITLRYSLYKI